MSNANDELESVDRRTVLKSVAAGATLIGGMSSTAAARTGSEPSSELVWSHAKRATEPFLDNDDAIQRAFDDQAEEVREQLAAEGVSMEFSTEEFDEVRTFPDHHEGTPTAHVVAEYEDADRFVRLHVLPQADRAFAIEKTDSERRRFDAAFDSPKPTVFCETSTTCDGYCNPEVTQEGCQPYQDGIEKKEECCTYSDGSTSCETISTTCTSDCPGKDC